MEGKANTPALLSFIIPAKNEQRLLRSTLTALHEAINGRYAYEIVVVDNASTDDTARIASTEHAVVIGQQHGTIGSLRNTGVAASHGRVIVFLDADVLVTAAWASHLDDLLSLLDREPLTITGSMCSIPQQASWIERSWFAPRRAEHSSHVGTGHMVLTRQLFDAIGGFDEHLPTGEDYDLCYRARQEGARVFNDDRLTVEHRGYPTTLRAFIRREIWHGRSDFRSLSAILASPVAIVSTLFALLHIVAIAGLLLRSSLAAIFAIAGLVTICAGSAVRRYHHGPLRLVLTNSMLFYFYYAARAASAFRRIDAARASTSHS